MDKEQVKKLAAQAGEYACKVHVPPVRSKTPGKIWEDGHVDWHDVFNEKFAELVRDDYSNKHAQLWLKRIDEAVKAEREACAKACELTLVAFGKGAVDWNEAANACAAAIRARGNT